MSEITIRTNNQARTVIYWGNLTDKEREQFDYMDSEDKQDSADRENRSGEGSSSRSHHTSPW